MTHRLRAYYLGALLVLPGLADAHSPIKGADNFYNGLLHPVLVPAHVMLLVAFGLFIGQQGAKKILPELTVFFLSSVTGLTIAWFTYGVDAEAIVLGGAALIGLLVAASPRIPLQWYSIIAALAGFFLGLDSAQDTLTGRAKLVTLLGSAVGINLSLLYPIAFADYFSRKHWQKIGLRVIGSWLAASALLVLALSFSSVRL